jgi:hypothetical protein
MTTRLETEQEYNSRMKASIQEEVAKRQDNELFVAIDKFFETKVTQAFSRGDKAAANFYAALGNEFLEGEFEYYFLSYREALKKGKVLQVDN